MYCTMHADQRSVGMLINIKMFTSRLRHLVELFMTYPAGAQIVLPLFKCTGSPVMPFPPACHQCLQEWSTRYPLGWSFHRTPHKPYEKGEEKRETCPRVSWVSLVNVSNAKQKHHKK